MFCWQTCGPGTHLDVTWHTPPTKHLCRSSTPPRDSRIPWWQLLPLQEDACWEEKGQSMEAPIVDLDLIWFGSDLWRHGTRASWGAESVWDRGIWQPGWCLELPVTFLPDTFLCSCVVWQGALSFGVGNRHNVMTDQWSRVLKLHDVDYTFELKHNHRQVGET